MRESVEIQCLFSRNFPQIQVLRENAQKFVRAKISIMSYTQNGHEIHKVLIAFGYISSLSSNRSETL